MKRESRKRTYKRSYKRGGGDILAYPSSNIHRVNNLAYTGESQKGGTRGIIYYPKSNPPFLEKGLGFIPGSMMKGGSCGCSKWFGFGGRRKRTHKKRYSRRLKGGYVNYAGYPNGLVGSTWTGNPETWPGVNGPGNNLAFNQYKVVPQTAMVQTNSNYPHNGANTNNLVIRGGKREKQGKRTKKRKGGASIVPQPISNLGNNIQYNTESIYNRLNGIPAPVNPNPWKDQL
jgi:hypothetical protein